MVPSPSRALCHRSSRTIFDILAKFGYKVVSADEGASNVWTLQRTPSLVTSAMKHLVVESPYYTSNALLWGAVLPKLKDVFKKAGCKETKCVCSYIYFSINVPYRLQYYIIVIKYQ